MEPKEKEIKEWLELIEDETIRKKALKNHTNKDLRLYDEVFEEPITCTADALSWAFDWSLTDEGAEYWENVYADEINKL